MIRDLVILPDGREIFSGAAEAVSIQSCTLTLSANAANELDFGCACAAMLQLQLLDTTAEFTLAADTPLRHYRVDEDGQRHFTGTFYACKPRRTGLHTLDITAYDAMILAEADATGWLATLTGWPLRMEELLQQLCGQCGLRLAPAALCNGSYYVPQFARQVTYRQLIAWIAGANGRFARINAAGELEFAAYTQNPRAITKRDLKSLTLSEIPCAPIDAVVIRRQAGDVGVRWPESGEQVYEILDNPMLTAFTPEALLGCAQRLYEQVENFSYTPFRAEVFLDGAASAWMPGELVTVDGHSCAVFRVTLRGNMATLESTGEAHRQSAAARYGRDKARLLQGQMMVLEEDITGIRAQVSRVEAEFSGLEVGGRNRIRESSTLSDPAYFFASGAAAAPEATVSGTAVRISDADPQSHPLTVTAQPGTTVRCLSKNLLTYPYYLSDSTQYGITFTDNGDGTVTVNGTATQRAIFYCNVAATGIYLPAGQKFTFGGTPEGGGQGRYFLQCTNSSVYPTDYGDGISFTSDGSRYRFYIVVEPGVAVENAVFKPQLELGEQATAFESYSCQEGTADARGAVTGLISLYPTMTLYCADGSPLTVTYRRIAALAAVTDTDPFGQQSEMACFTVESLPEGFCMPGIMTPGQTYTFSCWLWGTGFSVAEGTATSPQGWQRWEHTFTAQSADLTLEFTAPGSTLVFHPQLELGSVATDWTAAPEDMESVVMATREDISRVQVASDKLSAQVTQIQQITRSDMELMERSVQTLRQQVSAAVTAQQLEVSISSALEQGAEKVVTSTGYVLDADGLRISTSRSDMSNLLDHRGMRVSRGDEVILRADAAGVLARDVKAENYLIVGTHARLEDYPANRTACFWL